MRKLAPRSPNRQALCESVSNDPIHPTRACRTPGWSPTRNPPCRSTPPGSRARTTHDTTERPSSRRPRSGHPADHCQPDSGNGDRAREAWFSFRGRCRIVVAGTKPCNPVRGSSDRRSHQPHDSVRAVEDDHQGSASLDPIYASVRLLDGAWLRCPIKGTSPAHRPSSS